MSLVMSKQEREAFLAGMHVGVLSVARDGVGPLTVPIWYRYEPGGEVEMWMGRPSRKFRAIAQAGRCSLLAQNETYPYQYVSVEGPADGTGPPTRDTAVAIAARYLPSALAEAYVDDTLSADSVLVRLRPERWLSTDYHKAPAHAG